MVAGWRRVAGLIILLWLAACTADADAWPSGGPAPTSAVGGWTKLPDTPLSARHDAAGAWVGDRFVVVGGRTEPPCPPNASCAGPLRPAERDGAAFDPATGRWHSIEPAPTPVAGRNVVVVDGAMYVLVAGSDQEPTAFVRYDPSGRWDRLPAPADESASLVAGDHAVYAIAGSDEQQAAIDQAFDPDTRTWQQLPDDPLGPSFGRESVWFGDRLLLAAADLVADPGSAVPALVRLAWWDPASERWSEPSDTELIGWGPRSVADRVVWPDTGTADGGEVNNWGRSYAAGGIYDPSPGTWSELPTPPDDDGLVASGLVVGSRIVVGPTLDGRRPHQGGHLLDPATGVWTKLTAPPGPHRSAEVTVAGDDTIFVWGGSTAEANLADGYLVRP